jgi:iron complex outermembrane receptor protein
MSNFYNFKQVCYIIALFSILNFVLLPFANANEDKTVLLEDARISGTVKDIKGESVVGANVVIKGTSKGTVTDIDGNFTIEAEIGQTLVVSFTSYKTQEVVISGSLLNITLVEDEGLLGEVAIVGSRFSKPRTDTDRPVPIDVINLKEIQQTGQVDLGQSIHYTAPSFNAVKFGINDGAPFVDPASLRGMGPDQTLVLVNNKRRHKVSFLSINDGVGKGQPGTDVNVVPSLSLKRVEVLRDGAAAQYGSDAIAGVVNLQLNDANSGGAVNVYYGQGYSKPNLDVKGIKTPELIQDGTTYNFSANVGLKLTSKGFLNTTLNYSHTDGYDRSGPYSNPNATSPSTNFYTRDVRKEDSLLRANNINLDRAILGSAESTTYGVFVNSGYKLNDKWDAYLFGGYTNKHVVTGVFTRPPSNARRSVLEIFPNGYNPVAPADLNDLAITGGMKGKIGNGWNSDFSLSHGSNKVDWYAEDTVNPSLGKDSPTEFYVGQTHITQSLINADIAKTFREGSYPNFSIGAGTEVRYETFEQKAGDEASYKAGPLFKTKDVGSSGREGFSDKTAGKWNRKNFGLYVEAESELNKTILVGAAVRGENYSDFGANLSYKLNSRIKITENSAIRGSVSRGFRAPSMTQSHYSNYVNISFDNAGNSIINPVIPATSELAKILGIDGLKQETSFDISSGIMMKFGDLSLTTDFYQIDVDNRIMLSGGIPTASYPEFVAAGFPQQTTVFVNAIDTRTRGLEAVASYNKMIDTKNKIGINIAYSSMNTELVNNRTVTDTKGNEIVVVDATAAKYITDGLPKSKFIASFNYDYKFAGILLRATRFGEVSDPLATKALKSADPNEPTYQTFGAKTLFDIALNIYPIKNLTITAGINNITDVYPDLLQIPQTTNEVIFSRRTNQFGTQGRFWFASVLYKF